MPLRLRSGSSFSHIEKTDSFRLALTSERYKALRFPQIPNAFGHCVAATANVIGELNRQVESLEGEITASFDEDPDSQIVHIRPRPGTILGARLGEFGDDPEANGIPTPSLAKATPALRLSLGTLAPSGSRWLAMSVTRAIPTPATSGPSQPSTSHLEQGLFVTGIGPLETATTEGYERWPIASSAFSMNSSKATLRRTNVWQGPTITQWVA